jgi:hypothetical protein
MKEGKVKYCYNWVGLERYPVPDAAMLLVRLANREAIQAGRRK